MRFTEILFTATVITGLIWLFDVLFLKPRRKQQMEDREALIGSDRSGLRRTSTGRTETFDEKTKEPVLVEYAKAFFPILLIVLVVRSFIVEPFRIPSGSMRPTLLEGDFIIVNKYDYGLRMPFTNSVFFKVGNPQRGDVIIFKHSKRAESLDMIKRVVGVPGDHIQYKNNTIYINGEAQKQTFISKEEDKDPQVARPWPAQKFSETIDKVRHEIYQYTAPLSRRYTYHDVIVPENSYFVMGDNRDNSDDSRYWGFVKNEDVLGKAFGIWMSWDSSVSGFKECLYHCIRWDRIGNSLGTVVKE